MHIMNGSFSRDGGCSFIFLMCLSLVPAHVAVASASEPIVAWFMEWLTITWEVLEPRVARCEQNRLLFGCFDSLEHLEAEECDNFQELQECGACYFK